MAGTDVKFSTRKNETYDGYVSAPAGDAKAPGILLITAIFGTDAEMRTLSDEYARDGFLVWTPDVFWRTMPGPTADFGKALARYESFDRDQGLQDMEDLLKAMRADPRCNGKVAMLGFCLAASTPISPPRASAPTPPAPITAPRSGIISTKSARSPCR